MTTPRVGKTFRGAPCSAPEGWRWPERHHQHCDRTARPGRAVAARLTPSSPPRSRVTGPPSTVQPLAVTTQPTSKSTCGQPPRCAGPNDGRSARSACVGVSRRDGDFVIRSPTSSSRAPKPAACESRMLALCPRGARDDPQGSRQDAADVHGLDVEDLAAADGRRPRRGVSHPQPRTP